MVNLTTADISHCQGSVGPGRHPQALAMGEAVAGEVGSASAPATLVIAPTYWVPCIQSLWRVALAPMRRGQASVLGAKA